MARSLPTRSGSCSSRPPRPLPEARHDRRRDQRPPRGTDGLHPRDPRRDRRHQQGAGDPPYPADVGRQLDPRDRPRRRDADRRRGDRADQPAPLARRRRLRDDERRRRLRRHGPDAPDVPEEAGRGQAGDRRCRGRVVTALEIVGILVRIAWLVGAVGFVIGLSRMNSPATARNGNLVSAGGMAIAIGATAILILVSQANGVPVAGVAWVIIVLGVVLGGGLGLYTARTVKMTAMPQLVSLFNAVGGGAAALIAIDDYLGLAAGSNVRIDTHIFIVLDIIIGSITFTGSIVASGKLQGLIPGKPIQAPAGQLVTLALAAITVIAALALFVSGTPNLLLMVVILAAALIFGVTMTLPIGGGGMPVVPSLPNSFTGTAVAMAGFVIDNPVLIIAGALVGASGAILTKLMADAMNRSVLNIMIGGVGGGGSAPPPPGGQG